jgi:hypothetical protein
MVKVAGQRQSADDGIGREGRLTFGIEIEDSLRSTSNTV